ncbi:hypothetical protein [Aquimarina sediminis]|uniref:hypothetical protein n=1 Tax=Aquimarina sediminis TaxID=2070536 RepID=UPI000CA018C9|nr:hypothetical protein [Aquimarina sediminis]
MKQYKRHIALFFALLFVTTQLSHTLHNFSDTHNHHQKRLLSDIGIDDDTVSKNNVFFDDICDCLLCEQHQTIKLSVANPFNFEIKEATNLAYRLEVYTSPLFSTYLLENSSLRGPPASC